MAAPAALVRDVDVLVMEAGDDAEVGRFVLGRVRALETNVPVLLAVQTLQLTRVDPAWSFDDLILQPYVPQELYVRLRALEWRASEFAQPERIKLGALVLDLAGHEALLGGRRLALAPREFALLVHLARHRGRALSRASILRDVWQTRATDTRTLNVHVRRLRAHLGDAVVLETVRGIGYRLGAAPPTNSAAPQGELVPP